MKDQQVQRPRGRGVSSKSENRGGEVRREGVGEIILRMAGVKPFPVCSRPAGSHSEFQRVLL